jgi:hypothetical protein
LTNILKTHVSFVSTLVFELQVCSSHLRDGNGPCAVHSSAHTYRLFIVKERFEHLTTRGENGALGLAGTLIFAPHRCVSSEEAEL